MPDASHATRRRDAPASSGMTRKRFLWTLGTGAAAIAGHFLVPAEAWAAPTDPAAGTDAEPWLRSEVEVREEGDGLMLRWPTATRRPVVCVVNGAGAEVVRRLDGRTSVNAIAIALAERAGTSAVAEVEVKVACFVAQLAELGFLRAPYYALIAERVDG